MEVGEEQEVEVPEGGIGDLLVVAGTGADQRVSKRNLKVYVFIVRSSAHLVLIYSKLLHFLHSFLVCSFNFHRIVSPLPSKEPTPWTPWAMITATAPQSAAPTLGATLTVSGSTTCSSVTETAEVEG